MYILTFLQPKSNRKSSSLSPMRPGGGGASVISEAAMAVKMDVMIPYVSGRLQELTNDAVLGQMADSAPIWNVFGTASKSLGGNVIATINNKIEVNNEVIPFLSVTILGQHIAHCTGGQYEARLWSPPDYEGDDSFLFIQVPVAPDDLNECIKYLSISLEIQNGSSESRDQYYRASKISIEKEKHRVYAIRFEGLQLYNDLLQSVHDAKKDGGLTVRASTWLNDVKVANFPDYVATIMCVTWEIPYLSEERIDVDHEVTAHDSTADIAKRMREIKLKLDAKGSA